jgi:hypothetical protein
VYLGTTYAPISQTDERNAFELSPASTAVLLPQACHFPDGTPHRNWFNVYDVTNDLEMHA